MARKTTKPTVVKSPKPTKPVDAQQVETNKRTINKSPKSIKAVDSKSVEPIKPIVDKSPKLSKQVDDKPTKTEKQVGKFFVKKDSCVYVRYRQGKPPIRDEIRLLHPGIIDVRYPRQKSAKYGHIFFSIIDFTSFSYSRFCHLEFESKEAAIEGAKQMKIAHGKKMLIKYMKPSHDNSQNKSQNKSSDGESENVESSEEDEETSQVNTRQTKKKANLKVAKSHENQVPTKWYNNLFILHIF